MFDIKKVNYFDSKGNPVSKEAFDKERIEFQNELENKYNNELDKIASFIPKGLSDYDKLRVAYVYMVSNVKYDYDALDRTDKDGYVVPSQYFYKNSWTISSGDKYSAILLKKGICSGIAPAFLDLCSKLDLECGQVSGETITVNDSGTKRKHLWNATNIGSEKLNIDITYGIFNKDKGLDTMSYFCISDNELEAMGPHNNFRNKNL